MEEQIEGVRVVIRRMFEVHAVRSDLALRFPYYDFPPLTLPPLSRRRAWTKSSDEEQPYTFAKQVRVWREVSG